MAGDPLTPYGPVTERDWLDRHVDLHCLDCDRKEAGGWWCSNCSSRNVELRTHAQTPVGEVLWCGRLKRAAPTKPPA